MTILSTSRHSNEAAFICRSNPEPERHHFMTVMSIMAFKLGAKAAFIRRSNPESERQHFMTVMSTMPFKLGATSHKWKPAMHDGEKQERNMWCHKLESLNQWKRAASHNRSKPSRRNEKQTSRASGPGSDSQPRAVNTDNCGTTNAARRKACDYK